MKTVHQVGSSFTSMRRLATLGDYTAETFPKWFVTSHLTYCRTVKREGLRLQRFVGASLLFSRTTSACICEPNKYFHISWSCEGLVPVWMSFDNASTLKRSVPMDPKPLGKGCLNHKHRPSLAPSSLWQIEPLLAHLNMIPLINAFCYHIRMRAGVVTPHCCDERASSPIARLCPFQTLFGNSLCWDVLAAIL